MKINSAASIEAADSVFRSYEGSWAAARKEAHRDADGVLVILKRPVENQDADVRPARQADDTAR